MYTKYKVRLLVELFIKYVSNNGPFYIDITNNKTVNKAEKYIKLNVLSLDGV